MRDAAARAPAGALQRTVGVEVVGEATARGATPARQGGARGLFGGQMIAQCLAATAHTVPAGLVPDSLHANLLSGGRPGASIDYAVEQVRDGRSLRHREVRGRQDGEAIVQATVIWRSAGNGPGGTGDLDWQRDPMPEAAEPEAAPDAGWLWGGHLDWGLFDVAPAASDVGGSARVHPLWVRSREPVPDESGLRAAVVAFWSDFGLNWSVREACRERAGAEVQSVSVSHALWLHRRSDLEDWHLFDVRAQSLAGSQGWSRGALYHRSGALVASVVQGVSIRRAAPERGRS